MDDKELRKRVEAILHLNGCQQRTSGYNEAIDGKDLDTNDTERLESVALDEVMALFSRQLNKAVVGARIDELQMLIPNPVAEMSSIDYKDELEITFDNIHIRIATLKQQLKGGK